MNDLREACEEWLDDPGTHATVLDDLVLFVQAQRLAAARRTLKRLTETLCYSGLDPSKPWKSLEVAEVLRTIRDSIEKEGA
jgi:hypothetical protein